MSPQDQCKQVVREAVRQAEALLADFRRVLGNPAVLPDGCTLAGRGWQECETAMEQAASTGDLLATRKACADYVTRVTRYLARWLVIEGKEASLPDGVVRAINKEMSGR